MLLFFVCFFFAFEVHTHCLLASRFLTRRSLINLLKISFMWWVSSLLLLSKFSVFGFQQFDYNVSQGGSLGLLGIHWISWICGLKHSIRLRHLQPLLIQPNLLLFLFSPSGTCIVHIFPQKKSDFSSWNLERQRVRKVRWAEVSQSEIWMQKHVDYLKYTSRNSCPFLPVSSLILYSEVQVVIDPITHSPSIPASLEIDIGIRWIKEIPV